MLGFIKIVLKADVRQGPRGSHVYIKDTLTVHKERRSASLRSSKYPNPLAGEKKTGEGEKTPDVMGKNVLGFGKKRARQTN